jgi:Uma2 family endonuclease
MLFGPELHLGADILVPDLGGWRRTRLRRVPDEAYFSVAPDWICEVLSPATYRLDRVKKLRIYAREGVAHAWLVHPGERGESRPRGKRKATVPRRPAAKRARRRP